MIMHSDPAVKQILLFLDESIHFIIENLDEEHLFVDAQYVDMLQKKIDEILEENTYRLQD